MKAQLTIEVRVQQQGNFGSGFTLADNYVLELSSLRDFAEVLVKLKEVAETVVNVYRVDR